MADQTNIISLNPNTFSTEVYSSQDEGLITSLTEDNTYDLTQDYVEFFVYSLNNSIVAPSGNDGTFSNYRVIDNELYIDPEVDTNRVGISTGTVNNIYNFLRKRISSSPQSTYYISEISSDRTEIRLDSTIISREEIIASTNEFVAYREQDETFPDFYLNFGSNTLLIANNIQLDTDNTILIKLYEPLPQNITVNTSLWVVEKISNGLAFRVEFPTIVQLPTPQEFFIQGPNYNLANKTELNNSTEEITLTSLNSPNSQSEDQLNSLFNDPSIKISEDYTDFGNFVNFSSAKARIENFQYKVGLIQSASAQITIQSAATSTSYTSSSLAPLNNLIKDTITNFDRFEYYLYFETGSNTYPKTNSIPPYENALTGSTEALDWYDTQITSASNYDELNQDWIYYSIPEYIRDDSSNDQYLNFTNMMGQFVDDNIWVYLKDTTNKWDADNRINKGVSKDLVAQVLRDMGVKLYQNNFSSTDLYSAFLGFTDSGSLFPFPNMTGSVEIGGLLDTPDGYEYITNFISSSDEAIPLDDINKRIYKRIYHNLPYLLKSKGTVAGLRTLITSYGIPDTILRISEFGGKDKINTNDWDLWQHQYNFQYDTNDAGLVQSPWGTNTDWGTSSPQTIQFRFKVPKSGSNAVDNAVTTSQQVLWSLQSTPEIAIGLDYFGDGFTSGSYSGSVPSQSLEYANLVFTTDDFATTSSVYLPFFDGEWWSVALTKENDDFTLYAGDKIYDGNDGSQIGFIGSASVNVGGTDWDNATNSFFPSDTRNPVGSYTAFSGSYQEIRYFNQAISQSVFKDYVMNPQSTEGNGVNGSETQLLFRASLGGELYTGLESIHPKYSTFPSQSSFPSSNSSFTITDGSFTTNREYIFYDSPPVGIKNRNTDKIKRQDLTLPPGNTEDTGSLGVNVLSNLKTIQQSSFTTDDYTNNLNLLEVAFSPQNEINDDIINQIGFFNVGDYIGDPRLISSSADTYPSLVELSKQYFKKYTSSYDVYDYIRLIKFFDNSLFKMIKDFVPTRTGLASGIVVKQHILERQKYPTPQLDWTRPEYTGSIGSTPALLSGSRYYEASTDYESIPIETISGSDGGTFLPGYVTQSWDGINVTPLGDVPFTQDNKEEFIDGEFSGSVITVTDGELNPGCDEFKEADTSNITFDIEFSSWNPDGTSLNPTTIQLPFTGGSPSFTNAAQTLPAGDLNIWWNSTRVVENLGAPGKRYTDTFKLNWIAISKTSKNGIDLTTSIPNVTEFTFLTTALNPTITGVGTVSTTTSTLKLNVISIKEYANSYLIQVSSDDIITLTQTVPSGAYIPNPVVIPSQNDTLSVLNPYIEGNFANSDCNPIMNNATDITPSTVYYDVDYANNPNVAVNFDTILAGTSPKAKIQDFNYHTRRSTIPRYEGSKNGTTTEYSVTGASIDATQALFGYFNWVGGTSPEWGNGLEDRSVANLRFLLDVNGKIIKPIADSKGINQGIIENNFTEGKIATLAFDDKVGSSAAFSNLLGDHTIFKSGKDITPIAYSQTESISSTSGGGYTSSLNFVQGDQQQNVSIGDYRLLANADGVQSLITNTGTVSFPNDTIAGANVTAWAGTTYSPAFSAPTGVTLTFKVYLETTQLRPGSQVVFNLERIIGGVSSVIATNTWDIGSDSFIIMTKTLSNVVLADSFKVTWSVNNQPTTLPLPTLKNTSYFQVTQTPPPNLGAATSYWTKGTGATTNVLTLASGTGGLNNFYGQKQEDIAGTGFFGIVNDFILQPVDGEAGTLGDEIRFEGTETQTYTVTEVKNTNPIEIVVDRPITATNVDWFLVRRYVDNPANIILEVDKPAGGTSPGILKPQYLSRDAEDNIDTILENLRRDALI
jgi:hypothetical protein